MKHEEITEKDLGRKVIFIHPPETKKEPEYGRITSFNDEYIFVDYSNSGRGIATRAGYLHYDK